MEGVKVRMGRQNPLRPESRSSERPGSMKLPCDAREKRLGLLFQKMTKSKQVEVVGFQEMTEKQITEFLIQSNYIENERTQQAHDDARVAWDYLVQTDELTSFTLRETHRFLLRHIDPDIAGRYRDVGVMVGGRLCPQAFFVPVMVDRQLKINPSGWDEIKEWHTEFEFIHPFRDGNGRTGRIIMNWHRVKQGLPLLVIHEGEEQMEYYEWFEADSPKPTTRTTIDKKAPPPPCG